MSFNIDFVTKQENAAADIDAEHAPECVKAFLKIGAAAFQQPGQLVRVKAVGHLSDSGNLCSTCEIFVGQIIVRA